MADNSQTSMQRLFQTAGTAKPQQGTGYTNLNRLFEANKQNQLGQKVAGTVGAQIGGVQSQLADQQKQFKEEAEKGQLGGQKDVEQREAVLGRFTSPSSTGDATEQDVSAFERFRSGQYAGPQNLKDTSALKQSAQQLQGQVSNFSPSGTQELLRQTVGGGRYTQGQSRLDSLLMDRSKLTPVARQAGTLGQQINRADLAASGQAEANKNLAQQFAKETQERLTGSMGGIETAVQGQLASAQQAEKDRIAAMNEIIYASQGFKPTFDAQGNAVIDPTTGKQVTEKIDNSDLFKTFDSLRGKIGQTGGEDFTKKLFGSEDQYSKLKNVYSLAKDYSPSSRLDSAQAKAFNELSQFAIGKTPEERAAMGQGYIGDVLSDTARQNLSSSTFGGLGSTGGDLLKRISDSTKEALSRNAAEGLTEQGVASEQQRASYEALNKLLGRTAAESKLKKEGETFKAGKSVYNPEFFKY